MPKIFLIILKIMQDVECHVNKMSEKVMTLSDYLPDIARKVILTTGK